ncbi:U3 snoRNP protein [Coemansia asiatica]|nr:U3 snoRNP protein [Coemansia asiatica]
MKDTTGIASQLNTSGGANTYRFKSFKQRADEIEINVARRLVRDFEEPEDNESYFAECVSKQGELNCTGEYTEFYNRIKNYHQSLAQVLYHKDEIISVIESYLSLDHELVLESMLDLVTTLARDLQDEIMPYFERLVTKIAPLVKADIAEVVEAAYNALAYLFKYLAKYLVSDLRPTFDLLTPLLGVEKQKANVRRFAAESLAFLIRKLRGDPLQQLVHHIVVSLSDCSLSRLDSYRDGLSLLFFECMRGVDGQLHSRASGTLTALLHELFKDNLDDNLRLEDNTLYMLVASTLKLCLHCVKREQAMELWTVLFNEFDKQQQKINKDGCSDQSIQPLVSLTGLLALATLMRKGSRVIDYAPLLQRCRKTFEISKANELADNIAETFAHERIKWLTALLMQCNVAEMVSIGRVLLDMAVAQESLHRVLSMALTLARLQWQQWQQIMLPYVVQLTIAKWLSDRTLLLLFWAELLQKNLFQPQGSISSVITSSGQIIFAGKNVSGKASAPSVIATDLLNWLNEPVQWQQLIENRLRLPSSENVEFNGFDSKSSLDSSDITLELAIRSAILSMIAQVSVESTFLLESLGTFSSQLCNTVADLTQQLNSKNSFLNTSQQDTDITVQQSADSEQLWSDSATSALGIIDTAADDRLYWGKYYQILPLVSLLGRALEMQATRALQVEPKLATQSLLGSWHVVMEKVVPAHASNVALVSGLRQIGESLKYIASAKKQAVDVFTLAQLYRIFPYFERNLASFQASLRLKTLQLLAIFEQPQMTVVESKEEMTANKHRRGPPPVCEMVTIAVELESVKVSFDTHKERMNHLRRMAVFAANGNVPAVYQNVFPYIAVAQLSVNFRTVWSDASAQLAQLASANAELFWKAVWNMLSNFNDERRLVEPGLTPSAKKQIKAQQEQWEEQCAVTAQPKVDGHALECPNVVRFDRVYDYDLQLFGRSSERTTVAGLQYLMISADGQDLERIDYTNVQRLFLKLIADCGATIAEKHSRPVVRSFLAFVRFDLDWTAALYRKGLMKDDVDLNGVRASEFCGLLTDRGRKQTQSLLELWLGVFAKMRSPRSLYKWSTLYDLFTRMLSRGDNAVQRRALDCLLIWRESEIMPYADNLRNLLDEKRFRDELGSFDLATTGESINVVHREKLLPMVFRILHGQALVRNGKAARKDGMKIRRAAVLSAMSAVSPDELRLFVSIGLESFRAVLESATPEELVHGGSNAQPLSLEYKASDMDVDEDEDDQAIAGSDNKLPIDKVSSKAQISFFNLLSEMVRQLGFKTMPVLHESLVILLSSIESAQRQIDVANKEIQRLITAADRESSDEADQDDTGQDEDDLDVDDDEDVDEDDEGKLLVSSSTDNNRGQLEHRKSVARSVRHLALKCLTQLFTLQPPDFSFEPYLPSIYQIVINPRLEFLSTENTQSGSVLLRLLKSWTLTPRYFSYLTEYNPMTLKMLLDILIAPKVQPEVVTLVLDVLQTLLDFSPETAVEQRLLSESEAVRVAELTRGTIQKHVSQILSHMRTCFSNSLFAAAAAAASSKSTQGAGAQAASVSSRGGNSLALRQIHILSRVSEFATQQTADAKALLDLLLPILRRPNSVVPERTKGDVLEIMRRFVPLVLESADCELTSEQRLRVFASYLDSVSSCFGRIRLESARTTLSDILSILARIDKAQRIDDQMHDSASTPLENAAAIIQGINSVSQATLGGPDFEQRLEAFARLNERLWNDTQSLNALAWVPLLHNLTFFAQELDEVSIRSNAAFGLVRFISLASIANSERPENAETRALNRSMTTIVLPAIRFAFTSKHEDIRTEFIEILRRAVHECGNYFDQLRDLMVLDSSDEEANFFYNIVHIQLHRRLRALRRFRNLVVEKPISDRAASQPMDVDEASGKISDNDSDGNGDNDSDEDIEVGSGSKQDLKNEKPANSASKSGRSVLAPLSLDSGNENISPISQANIRGLFMPLFEHWALADEAASVNPQLTQDAIQTIGSLSAVMSWSQYSSALRKYLGMTKKVPEMEKRLSRLVLSVLDSFHFDLRQVKVDDRGRLVHIIDAEEKHIRKASSSEIKSKKEQRQGVVDTNEVEGQDDVDIDDGNDESEMQGIELTAASAKDRRAERIHETVVTFLLPELKKKISNTNEDNMALRAPLAMALVRILTALPKQTMNIQLPGILTNICNMLRAKAQSARNATRDTLIRIIKFLGPAYFGFVVKELNSSLSRGPQRHILSYTIYTLLKELSRIVSVGQIDYTMEQLVEILIEDVFGQVAHEKEAEEWTTKTKEARVHHGPDCFEIIASICSFENVRMLLAPLRDILRETDTPKRTKSVDQVLHRISIGLNRNRSYSTEAVLKFCYSIINQYLSMSSKSSKDTEKIKAEAELKRLRVRRPGDEEVTVYMKRADVLVKRDYLQANAHRFVEFGLGVIYYGLKGNRFDVKSPEVLGMLDPFVDLAGDALFSRFNSIIILGCKVWSILVRLPLPSVLPGIPVVINRLFSIFRKSATSNLDMIQSCFKLLAAILRSNHAEELMADYETSKKSAKTAAAATDKATSGKQKRSKSLLDETQLRDLIDFIRPDIEEPERQGTAFNLIRAVLSRRMLVDSLYTLMDTIRELMITAQADNMRELCRLTWFQFLMDYPLGKRRLDNAMTFIVQNATGYVFESGRTSSLEIMGVIVNRFADEILLPNAAEPFFLGLVLIIAKDDSSRCREMAVHLLPQLIARFDQERLRRVWVLLDQWSSGTISSAVPVENTVSNSEKAVREAQMRQMKMRELGRAALQCYGIIAEPLGERFSSRIPAFLKAVDTALSVSLRTWKQAEAKLNAASSTRVDLEQLAADLRSGVDPQQEALAYWETAYMALNTFGRFTKAIPARSVGDQGQSRIWLLAMRHMTHPHAWVRLAASRLFGAYVANAEPSWMLEAESASSSDKVLNDDNVDEWDVSAYSGKPKYVLMSVQRLRDLAHAMLIQLSGRGLTPELGNQIVKNLFFISKCFFTAVPIDDAVKDDVVSVNDEAEGSIDDGSSDDDSDDGNTTSNDDDNEDDVDDAADLDKLSTERSLLWLINRVGRLARTELIRGRGSTEKRNYCFRWFAAVVTLIPPQILVRPSYIMPIISTLHRTTEDSQVAQTQSLVVVKTPEQQLAELKDLASEVLKLVEKRIGVTAYTALLNKIQRHVDTVRQGRRERRKQLAIADPELHAKKKMRKHENSRRRKIEKIQVRNSKSQRTNIIVRRAPKV